MRAKITLMFVALCWFCCPAYAGDAQDKGADVIIYSKKMPFGRELVFLRGPDLDATRAKALLGADELAATAGLYSVRLELRSADAPPVVLWSRLKREPKDPAMKGLKILDLHLDPDELHVITLEFATLRVWRIDLSSNEVSCVILENKDWMPDKATPLNVKFVSAFLARPPLELPHLVHIFVTYLVPNKTIKQTEYEQLGDAWEFKLLSPQP